MGEKDVAAPETQTIARNTLVSADNRTPTLIMVVLVLAASCVLTLWYASAEFVPNLMQGGPAIGYDAYRYHIYAQRTSQYDWAEILWPGEDISFEQAGYPVLLALVYHLTGPSPYVGCMLNWLLWVAAGLLLVPLARTETDRFSWLLFLSLWLLYPESFDWNGTTSKEPLVAASIACALRLCVSRKAMWVQAVICVLLAGIVYWVRWVTVPLIAICLAVSFHFRKSQRHRGWYRSLLVAIAAIVAVYIAGESSAHRGDSDNPLATAGHSGTQMVFAEGLSDQSLLLRAGSSNRVVDSFWIPVRGLANVICPLYLSPRAFDTAAWLQWLSAALCAASALGIALRGVSGQPWTKGRAMAFSVLVLGLFALGLSGIVHPRYRSLIVASALPLGFRSIREEISEKGVSRLALGGAVLPVLVFFLYRILRQLS